MDCNDGKYCNGEEYCDNGQCINGTDVQCRTHFVCDEDARECVRDCNTFDIDGYLKCSSSFASIGDSVTLINGEIDDLDTRVTSNEGSISLLVDAVDVNKGNITALRAEFQASESSVSISFTPNMY